MSVLDWEELLALRRYILVGVSEGKGKELLGREVKGRICI
jgi:hypothetical protein